MIPIDFGSTNEVQSSAISIYTNHYTHIPTEYCNIYTVYIIPTTLHIYNLKNPNISQMLHVGNIYLHFPLNVSNFYVIMYT